MDAMTTDAHPTGRPAAGIHGPLLARHLEAENARRLDETLTTLTDDCVFEDMALGRVFRGRRGAGACYRLWWDAYEIAVHGERLHWAEDGAAGAEARYRGTHVGAFLGIPATGRSIDLPIAVSITFKDGLMAGERFYYDLATLLRQLGAASPAPGAHRA
jgi:steroid delta-isomerase-like uncharacterized protein